MRIFTTTDSGFGRLDLNNTDVLAADAATAGLVSDIFSNPNSPTAPNQFNMSGGSLITTAEVAIFARSLLEANITDGAVVTGGGGLLFQAAAALGGTTPPTNVNLFASGGSILTGDAEILSAPSIANFTITDNAVWTGAAINAGITNATIGATGTWNITANSLVTNQVSNTGRIAMVPAGNVFKTLTTNTYIGNGGILSLNTFLDTDGSPSDLLIIDGGTATGNTSLIVNNTTGLGALTVQNGILVVEAINGATTNSNAFTLGTAVLAGPYEYSLFYGSVDATGPQNWYLRSVRGDDPTEPDYRQEVSLYAALSSVGFLYGRLMLDTLHERVGEEEQLRNRPDLWRGEGGWIRFVYRDGNINDDDIFNKGPDFQYHFKALQAGADLYRQEHLDGSRDHAGLYIASGIGKANVEHTHGREAGNATVNVFSLGGYWTHFGSTGWYLDSILHGNWFDYVANSGRVAPLAPDGNGFAVSLEGGYPFKFGDRWVVEPQAQAFYQRQTICDASDNVATVRFGWTDGTTSRIGLRIAHDWVLSGAQHSTEPLRLFTGWLRANQWYQHGGSSHTEFSSDTGFIPFPSELSAQWIQLELGVTSQVTANTSLYATYSRDYYQHDRGRGSEAIAGLRVNL